jgi:hypothetical protein
VLVHGVLVVVAPQEVFTCIEQGNHPCYVVK